MKLFAIADPSPEVFAEILRSTGARINSGPFALHGKVPFYSWRRVGDRIIVEVTIRIETPLTVLTTAPDGSAVNVQLIDQVPSQAPLPSLLRWVAKRQYQRFLRTGRLI